MTKEVTGHAAIMALLDEFGLDNLWALYRAVYRHTACGPSIGFQVEYTIEQDNGEGGPHGVSDEQVTVWKYCDDLARPGPWIKPVYIDGVEQSGTGCNGRCLDRTPYDLTREFLVGEEPAVRIVGVSVGSIVEGCDLDAETLTLEGDEITTKAFWEAVEYVNDDANRIWNDTHGCDTCRQHWVYDEFGGVMDEYEMCPVWTECPTCEGEGVPR